MREKKLIINNLLKSEKKKGFVNKKNINKKKNIIFHYFSHIKKKNEFQQHGCLRKLIKDKSILVTR
jgi:hypothetical protein